MKGLVQYIPPLSSDYAGVCSALYELGGMIIIHNPSGCVRTYSYIDEPRWFDQPSLIFSSGLCDNDVIFGDDDAITSQIIALWEKVQTPFIALVGTPIPALTGTDLEGISRRIMNRIPVPVFFFDTTGFGSYSEGVAEAFLSLAQRFLSHTAPKVPSSINIIGSTPLDIGASCHIDTLHQLFHDADIQIIADWAMNGNIGSICQSSSAQTNIVISHTGLPLAEYLQEEYGIPFIASIPVGNYLTSLMISQVSGVQSGNTDYERIIERKTHPQIIHRDRHILIIAEPVLCNSIKQCLVHDFGYTKIVTASLNSIPGKKNRLELYLDHRIQSENELIHLINHDHFDVIIGDPLYERCLSSGKKVKFIPVPHVALSSHQFSKIEYQYVGENGYKYFDSHLFGGEKPK